MRGIFLNDTRPWFAPAPVRGIVFGLLAIAVISGCSSGEAKPTGGPAGAGGGPGGPPMPEVQYVTPILRTVTEHEEFSGRTWSPETVEIRSRVNGYLMDAPFTDGADLKKGDVLFLIDPDTHRTELERAVAAVGQAQSRADQAFRRLERGKRLETTRSITPEELDLLKFGHAEAKAALAEATANRDLAKLNLDFTTIRAPISGRIGRRLVDRGNLVKEDDTHLATIVSLDPIHAYFDFDERTIVRMRRLVEDGKLAAAPDRTRPIEIRLAGEDARSFKGKIDWVDNQIDVGTGTLRARVEVPNPDLFLSPGMFVRLRVPIGPEQQSLLIPEEALGSDQGHRFVYVLTKGGEEGKDDIVEYRRVTIGWLEGTNRVIESGLESGDRVVVTGLQRIRPKAKVKATPREEKPSGGETK